MAYYYDKYGWITDEVLPNRSTNVAPPNQSEWPEGHKPNWSGVRWYVIPYTEPPTPQPQKTEPRWISSAEFIRRIPIPIWDAINQARLTDMMLQRLKDMLITGDTANPGNVNLDAEELSQGLNYLITLGLLTAEQKTALLT